MQSDLLLEFVAEAATRRGEAEHHFRRTLAAARGANVPLARMIDWVADWVARDGTSWNKATHFETRDGNY